MDCDNASASGFQSVVERLPSVILSRARKRIGDVAADEGWEEVRCSAENFMPRSRHGAPIPPRETEVDDCPAAATTTSVFTSSQAGRARRSEKRIAVDGFPFSHSTQNWL